MTSGWLSTDDIAGIAGCTPRAVRKAIKAALNGGMLWRGSAISVRVRPGSRGGGRSGLQYEVDPNSLPFDLQAEWKALRRPVQLPLKLDAASAVERDWWTNALAPIVVHEPRTAERRTAIKDLLGRDLQLADGTWGRVASRTLDRKLALYAAEGSAGLTKRKRRDAGEARVDVTERWDKAVPFDATERERIGKGVLRLIRSLHAKGEALSQIALLARGFLVSETRAAGFEASLDELNALCSIPYNRIRAERRFRNLDRYHGDRKAHEDARSRISRHRDGLAPMSVVVGDVHPIDILYRRADGSTATPKAIAWLDLTTNRLWVDVLFPEKGKNVRAAHVAASFVRMTTEWGLPRHLYLDNGSEYGWAEEFIGDTLRLVDRSDNGLVEVAPWAARRSKVINALPYNAPAKPIEGIFGLIERLHLKRIPGWIGGDRLRKKSANHGREPDPFPGTVDELREQIRLCVAFCNGSPQRRSKTLKGKSPDSAFGAAVSAGWGRIAIDPVALQLAFSEEHVRSLRQGKVEIKGKVYTCPELQEHQGDRVIVMVPKFDTWSQLPVRSETGQIIGFAAEDTPYGFLDPAGAVEAHARAKRSRAGVRALEAHVDHVDVLGMAGQLLIPAPVKAPVATVIEHSGKHNEILVAFRQQLHDAQLTTIINNNQIDDANRKRLREISELVLGPRKPAEKES